MHKTVRTRRLMREMQEIERSQRKENPAFSVELINDNLYDWHVRLYSIDQESELANDMRLHDIKVSDECSLSGCAAEELVRGTLALRMPTWNL